MKKQKIIKLRQTGHIPVDRLRTYAEMLIEKFPKHFKDFQDGDTYRIFFPSVSNEHRQRVRRFRHQAMFILKSIFGDSVCTADLCLVFRFQDQSVVDRLMKNGNIIRLIGVVDLKREMVDVLNSIEYPHLGSHKNSHVPVSCVIDKKLWECLVPVEYLNFSEKIFIAIQEEFGCRFNKKLLCSSSREQQTVLARDIFVYVFCSKYKDVPNMFLAYILNRARQSTIVFAFNRYFIYTDPVAKDSQESKKFHKLLEKIKKKTL